MPADENRVEKMVSSLTEKDTASSSRQALPCWKDGAQTGVEKLSKREVRFDKPSVAGLAIGKIAEMSREELIDVIRGSDLPLIDSRNRQRLKYLDRVSLERLAQLARRCCRNQGY